VLGGVGSQVDVFVIRLWLVDFTKTQTLVSFNPIGSIDGYIWYIYLHCPDFHMVNVGKYTSPHRSCGNGTMTMTMTISDLPDVWVSLRSSMSNMVQEFFGGKRGDGKMVAFCWWQHESSKSSIFFQVCVFLILMKNCVSMLWWSFGVCFWSSSFIHRILDESMLKYVTHIAKRAGWAVQWHFSFPRFIGKHNSIWSSRYFLNSKKHTRSPDGDTTFLRFSFEPTGSGRSYLA